MCDNQNKRERKKTLIIGFNVELEFSIGEIKFTLFQCNLDNYVYEHYNLITLVDDIMHTNCILKILFTRILLKHFKKNCLSNWFWVIRNNISNYSSPQINGEMPSPQEMASRVFQTEDYVILCLIWRTSMKH